MTRTEAADYLRWNVRTIDRHLIPMRVEGALGKIRCEAQITGTVKRVRVLAEDVYAICPLPPGFEDKWQNGLTKVSAPER